MHIYKANDDDDEEGFVPFARYWGDHTKKNVRGRLSNK